MERIPTKTSPRLMAAVIQEMQVQLGGGLSWLNHVFGKAEKTVRDYNELRQYYQKHEHREAFYAPSVYVGGGKYEQIVPDRRDWGNYAFFYVDGPQEVTATRRVMPFYDLEGTVNVVVWCDTRDIEAQDDRNLEGIKSQVLQVLGGMTLTTGRVEWERVYDERDTWEYYSMVEDWWKYMLSPYFAMRVRGRIWCNSGCVVSG